MSFTAETTGVTRPYWVIISKEGEHIEIEGFVFGRSVITISNRVAGVWRVTSSTALPGDPQHALFISAAFAEAFLAAEQFGLLE